VFPAASALLVALLGKPKTRSTAAARTLEYLRDLADKDSTSFYSHDNIKADCDSTAEGEDFYACSDAT
jgi:hypothetical protein